MLNTMLNTQKKIKNTAIYLESGKCPKCDKHGSLFCRIEQRKKGKRRGPCWVISFIVKHEEYSSDKYKEEKVTGKRNSHMKVTKYCYLRGRTQYRLQSHKIKGSKQ